MSRPFTATVLLAAATLRGQGVDGYFNVESPHVKPIAVARVANQQGTVRHDYVLACNTPDQAIEIYDTHDLTLRGRVPTGAEPISVVWNATLSRLYSTNFLGDSVTMARLELDALGQLVVMPELTRPVGDEPMHAALTVDRERLLVSLGSGSTFVALDPLTLAPAALSGLANPQVLGIPIAQPVLALKSPRTLIVVPTGARGTLLALNLHGNKPVNYVAPNYLDNFDNDFLRLDLDQPTSNGIAVHGGLGTTNFNMALASNGDLYVVGGDAQFLHTTAAAVQAERRGFVRSMIWRVENPTTAPAVTSRDLHESFGGPVVPLAHPTDVAIWEPSGQPEKLYIAAFNSDRLGIVTLGGPPSSWTIAARDVDPVHPSNPMAGPRGVAIKHDSSGHSGDPGPRVYVLNRLDNSIVAVDPITDTVLQSVPLFRDPTPRAIRVGRQFLYGAQFSGTGFVACASCHVDGRTDLIGWTLNESSDHPIETGLLDGVTGEVVLDALGNPVFPAAKDTLVTQTLQGLVNHQVDEDLQAMFSNEPLHWRADRSDFLKFNAAFVDLQGMTDIGGTPETDGIPAAQMEQFRQFVFSISYPPNPEQPRGRKFSAQGASGLELFHTRPVVAEDVGSALEVCFGRSCVQCHALPSGTNRKITDVGPSLALGPNEFQVLKSPTLRLLRQKERVLTTTSSPLSSGIQTNVFGITHDGFFESLNHFIANAFQNDFTGQDELTDLIAFVREFDTGVGPLVGASTTIDQSTPSITAGNNVLDALEEQAGVANNGIAIQGVLGGTTRGFWYDLTVEPPVYREEPGGGTMSRLALLQLLISASPGSRLFVHAAPLGSERRLAWVGSGFPQALAGMPSAIALEPMVPATPWEDVPTFVDNWDPNPDPMTIPPPSPFVWQGAQKVPPVGTPPSLRAIRILQHGLLPFPQLGLSKLRHEAPRRFAVSGEGIRHGAQLVVEINTGTVPPGSSTSFLDLVLPLHPTNQLVNGRRVWQTAAELSPIEVYVLMHGGKSAPNVQQVLDGTFTTEPPPPGTFDPLTWNQYDVRVINENGQFGVAPAQQIRLSP